MENWKARLYWRRNLENLKKRKEKKRKENSHVKELPIPEIWLGLKGPLLPSSLEEQMQELLSSRIQKTSQQIWIPSRNQTAWTKYKLCMRQRERLWLISWWRERYPRVFIDWHLTGGIPAESSSGSISRQSRSSNGWISRLAPRPGASRAPFIESEG